MLARALISTAILMAIISTPIARAADGGDYLAHLQVVDNCPIDRGMVPKVSVTKKLSKHFAVPITPEREEYLDGVWLIDVRVDRAHQYLWVDTDHCEAKVPSMSLSGESRTYGLMLLRGDDIGLDERDAYIAGTLPIEGLRVDIVGINNDFDVARYGDVVGRNFYIEDLPLGSTWRLRVQFQQKNVFFPLPKLNTTPYTSPFELIFPITLKALLGAAAHS